MESLVQFPALHKMGVVVLTCNLSTQDAEAGGLEIQGHSQLYGKSKVRLARARDAT